MSSSWDTVHSYSFYFAARSSKVLLGVVVSIVLLSILYWMFKSIGIDRSTPFHLIWGKLASTLRSYYLPILTSGNWKKAARLEENKKYDAAVDLYVACFDFDGLINSKASIAIRNDNVLEHLEGICHQVGYPFPSERLNRLREDIYDYFLIKQKVQSPSDYDESMLIRPENEQRFSDKVGLSQERSLADGFENLLQSFAHKLKKHIISGAAPIVSSEQQAATPSVGGGSIPSMPALSGPAVFEPPADPFGQSSVAPGDEVAPPADLFAPPPSPVSEPLAPAPGIFGAGSQGDVPLPPPPDPFAGAPVSAGPPIGGPPGLEANPFSMDDPRMPHHEATGRMHKLPGAEDDLAFQSAPPHQSAPPPHQSAPPVSNPSLGGAPGFPQPTGGFPGFASQPQPTGGFPGFGSQPPGPAGPPPGAPGFPQPTGGFPGFASQPPGPAGPPPGAPGFPQPTGGFPGFASQPPGPAGPPPGAPGFPQPTGGFPGFGSQPPGPAGPPPGAPGFPQPTGGFPGFSSQPPSGSGFPQPTGGFPGFASSSPDKENK